RIHVSWTFLQTRSTPPDDVHRLTETRARPPTRPSRPESRAIGALSSIRAVPCFAARRFSAQARERAAPREKDETERDRHHVREDAGPDESLGARHVDAACRQTLDGRRELSRPLRRRDADDHRVADKDGSDQDRGDGGEAQDRTANGLSHGRPPRWAFFRLRGRARAAHRIPDLDGTCRRESASAPTSRGTERMPGTRSCPKSDRSSRPDATRSTWFGPCAAM